MDMNTYGSMYKTKTISCLSVYLLQTALLITRTKQTKPNCKYLPQSRTRQEQRSTANHVTPRVKPLCRPVASHRKAANGQLSVPCTRPKLLRHTLAVTCRRQHALSTRASVELAGVVWLPTFVKQQQTTTTTTVMTKTPRREQGESGMHALCFPQYATVCESESILLPSEPKASMQHTKD